MPRSTNVARDVDDEIELHLALRTESLVRGGLSESEARAEAIRRFGAGGGTRAGLYLAAVEREGRTRMRSRLDRMKQDLTHVMRWVVREPGLSAVIVVTLGLGIGANATMFGLIDRLLLRGPEHVVDSGELYRAYRTVRRPGFGDRTSSILPYASFAALRDGTRSFDGLAAYSIHPGSIGQRENAEDVRVEGATASFFPLLGVRAHLGRFPSLADDRPPEGAPVAVLSHALWQRRFGGDPGVLGQRILLNYEPLTIIGVAPPGFTGVELQQVDVWVPLSYDSRDRRSDWETTWLASWVQIVGRLTPEVSAESAGLDATRAHRAAYTGRSDAMRAADFAFLPIGYDGRGQQPLEVAVSRWLAAVAAVVLLIACANVMNLLLARSTRRRRDVAVRLAMGISRGRLVRQHLLHGVVLAAAGGLLALLIVATLGPTARRTLLPEVGWHGSVVDERVLAFTSMVALIVGLAMSVVPAMRAGDHELTMELKAGTRDARGRRGPLRTGLVLGQITLTFVLLVGAGVFARSLWAVRSLDLGIEADRVLTLSASWPPSDEEVTFEAYQRRVELRNGFYLRALERARGTPGVEAAAVAIGTPFSSAFTVDLRASGHDSIPEMPGGGPYVSVVTDGYFETTGLAILEGRPITREDGDGTEWVAVVSRTMADALWPDGALGACLYLIESNPDAPCSRIVGVAENANRFRLREEPAMQYYIPMGQQSGISGPMLFVRPAGRADDPLVAVALRAMLLELDPGLARVRAVTLSDHVDPQVRPWELGTTLFTLFAALALAIAAVGLYSVVSYMVADQTHEMGVRMALGADRGRVLALVLRRGALIAVAGLTLGALVALLGGRLIEPSLFETSARDPLVLSVVALVTVGVTLAATLVPALRASRIDAVGALRAD